MTREEIVEGLKAGHTLCVVRKDVPEAPIISDLIREGLVTTEIVQMEEQSSMMKVRWAQ